MDEPGRPAHATSLPALTIVAMGLLALLFVAHNHALRIAGIRLGPAVLGIAGLLFVAAALMTLDRGAEVREEPPLALEARLVPRLVECGLWALALAFVVRLMELAGG